MLLNNEYARSPPVDLHVLSIEEEDGRWNKSDVEVLCVDRDTVSVNNEDIGHFRHSELVLGKLRNIIHAHCSLLQTTIGLAYIYIYIRLG